MKLKYLTVVVNLHVQDIKVIVKQYSSLVWARQTQIRKKTTISKYQAFSCGTKVSKTGYGKRTEQKYFVFYKWI